MMKFSGTNLPWEGHKESHMKASNHSGEEKRNNKSFYRSASSSLAETAVFATLGLVGFVAVVIAIVSSSVPAGSKEDPLADLGRSPMVRYVVSGQLAADVRTGGAMVHYFFDADGPVVTNVIECPPTQTNPAMPTNTATVGPKA